MNEFLFVFVILIVLLVVYRLRAHKWKGAVGESRVARQLGKLNREQYKVLNDVLIRTSRGWSQIDHIVISIYGIFVFETKNYSGWIHGNENSEYWTQSIYENKTKFRNPIKQNWAHIYALKEVLSDFGQVTYHPIVVFAGSGVLKNVSSTIPVIHDKQVYGAVMGRSGTPHLSVAQVENIADKLNAVNVQDRGARKEHVRQVRHDAHDRRQKEQSLICPSCGGILVVRDGPYGRFYGCSNYPECRYKLNYRAR